MSRLLILVLGLSLPASAQAPASGVLAELSDIPDADACSLIVQARAGQAFSKLDSLCTDVGHRLSGSSGMAAAVQWSERVMKAEGIPKVWTEPVKVPHWVRGAESLEMLVPHTRKLSMLGLGSSVGADGVEADVVVVNTWDDLGPHVAGKIVLYNVVMPEGLPSVRNY